MANKSATVYIIDQGASMGQKRRGRDESDLEFGMRYVWDKVATAMSFNRKTEAICVVGLRTDDETDNPLSGQDGYENISVMMHLAKMEVPQLRELQDKIRPNKTENGDAISAIVVANQLICTFTRKLKYDRKIVLVTNGRGTMDDDEEQIAEVAKKLNHDGIELVVIGVDFDDPEFGVKEEDKSFVKAKNEGILNSLVEQCQNGVIGTAEEAVASLANPTTKVTRPFKSYEGQLVLGDPKEYETAMCIDVERYTKTKVARPVSASTFVVPGGNGDPSSSSNTMRGDEEAGDNGIVSAVRQARTYKVKDENAPGGKKDVDREELAKGYMYGRTAVHISESDENVTKLETTKEFSIIGFIPWEGYQKYLNMGETCITIAQKTNDKARMALASFAHALFERESYAIARIVTKDSNDPRLVLLAPLIDVNLKALIDVPIPFAEDVRAFKFPPLDVVNTVSGATRTKHRYLPEEDLLSAMSDYVDSMDLSTLGRDDEGQPTEYMRIEDTYSPALHHINQAIRRRAIEPDEPIGPPPEVLIKYSKPPTELVERTQKQLERLVAAAGVTKVPPKAKGKRTRNIGQPVSGLDVEGLLKRQKRLKISDDNAVPEFKQMLATADNTSVIEEATKQMSEVIRTLITDSRGGKFYGQATENLRVMREELTQLEEPGLYNTFVDKLKTDILGGELGGDRRDLLWEIRKNKLGLISQHECEVSDVAEDQATEFYSMKSELAHRGKTSA